MALLENCIGYGLAADRPAAGAPGAVYIDSDDNNVYRDNGITWDLVTTPWTPALVMFGLESALPTASTAGRVYFTSDSGKGLRDNGVTWDQVVAPPPPFAIQTMGSTDIVISNGNTLVISSGNGHTATLPDVAAAAGQWVAIHNTGGGASTIQAATGQFLDDGSSAEVVGDNSHTTNNWGTTILMSDGLVWHTLSHAFSG